MTVRDYGVSVIIKGIGTYLSSMNKMSGSMLKFASSVSATSSSLTTANNKLSILGKWTSNASSKIVTSTRAITDFRIQVDELDSKLAQSGDRLASSRSKLAIYSNAVEELMLNYQKLGKALDNALDKQISASKFGYTDPVVTEKIKKTTEAMELVAKDINYFKNQIAKIKDVIPSVAKTSASFIKLSSVMRGVIPVIKILGTILGVTLKVAVKALNVVLGLLVKALKVAKNAIVAFANAIKGIALGAVNTLWKALKGLLNFMTGIFKIRMGGVGNFLSGIFSIVFSLKIYDWINALGRALGRMAQMVAQAASDFQTLEIRLQGLMARELATQDETLSFAQALEAAIEPAKDLEYWIKSIALSTPFTVESISRTVAFGMAMDFTSGQSKRLAMAVGNYTAGMGLTNETLERIIFNFGQMQGAGKITGTELRDLARAAMMPINELLRRTADILGVSADKFDEFRKAASEGKVPVDAFIQAFIEFSEESFPGAMDRMSRTFTGVWSNIQDFIKSIVGDEILGPSLQKLTDTMAELLDRLLSQDTMEKAIALGDALSKIYDVLAKSIGNLVNSFKNLGQAFGFEASVYGLAKSFVHFGVTLSVVIDEIAKFVNFVASKITGNFTSLGADMRKFGYDLISTFAEGMAGAINLVVRVVNAIGRVLAFWMEPGSPPRFLPYLDRWGAEAFASYMEGWANVDIGVFQDIAKTAENYLRSIPTALLDSDAIQSELEGLMEDYADLDPDDLMGAATKLHVVKSVLQAREALQKALGSIRSGQTMTTEAIDKLIEKFGNISDPMREYVRNTIALAQADQKLAKAQAHLNAVTKKYDTQIEKLQTRLDKLRLGTGAFDLDQRIKELQLIINDPNATKAEKERARREIEALKIEHEISKLQLDKKKEVALAQVNVDAAQEKRDAIADELERQKALLDIQMQQNKLLSEMEQIFDDLATKLKEITDGGLYEGGNIGIIDGEIDIEPPEWNIEDLIAQVTADVNELISAMTDPFRHIDWNMNLEGFQAAFSAILTNLGILWDGFVLSLNTGDWSHFWDAIKLVASNFWLWFKMKYPTWGTLIENLFKGIKTGLATGDWSLFWESVKGIVNEFWKWFKEKFPTIAEVIELAWKGLTTGDWKEFWLKIDEIARPVIEWLDIHIPGIKDTWDGMIEGLTTGEWDNFWNSLREGPLGEFILWYEEHAAPVVDTIAKFTTNTIEFFKLMGEIAVDAINALGPNWNNFVDGLSKLIEVIIKPQVGDGGGGGLLMALSQFLLILGELALAGVIGVIGGLLNALGRLFTGLARIYEKLSGVLPKIGDAISAAFEYMMLVIKANLGEDVTIEELSGASEKLSNAILDIFLDFIDISKITGETIAQMIASFFVGFFTAVLGFVNNRISNLPDPAKEALAKMNEDIADSFAEWWGDVTESKIGQAVITFISTFMGIFEELYKWLVGESLIPDMLEDVKTAFDDYLNLDIIGIVNTFVDDTEEFFSDLKDDVFEYAEDMWEDVKEEYDRVASIVETKVETFKTNVSNTFDNLKTLVVGENGDGGIVGDLKTKVANTFTELGILVNGEDGQNGIIGAIRDNGKLIFDDMRDVIAGEEGSVAKLKEDLVNLFEKIKTAITGDQGVAGIWQGMTNAVQNQFNEAKKKIVGADGTGGYANTLKSNLNTVFDEIKSSLVGNDGKVPLINNKIVSGFSDMVKSIVGEENDNGQRTGGLISSLKNSIESGFTTIKSTLVGVDGSSGKVGIIRTQVVSGFQTLYNNLFTDGDKPVTKIGDDVPGEFEDIDTSLNSSGTGWIAVIRNGVVEGFELLHLKLLGGTGSDGTTYIGVLGTMKSAIENVFITLGTNLSGTTIPGIVTDIAEAFGFTSDDIETVRGFGEDIASYIRTGIEILLGGSENENSIYNITKSIFQSLIDNFSETGNLSSMWPTMRKAFSDIGRAIKAGVDWLSGKLQKADYREDIPGGQGLWKQTDFFQIDKDVLEQYRADGKSRAFVAAMNIVYGLKNGFKAGIEKIKEAGADLAQSIGDVFGSEGWFFEKVKRIVKIGDYFVMEERPRYEWIGKDIVTTIGQGISNTVKNITSAVYELAEAIWEAIKQFFRDLFPTPSSASFSTTSYSGEAGVLYDFGYSIGSIISAGMNASVLLVESAAQNLIDAATGDFNDVIGIADGVIAPRTGLGTLNVPAGGTVNVNNYNMSTYTTQSENVVSRGFNRMVTMSPS